MFSNLAPGNRSVEPAGNQLRKGPSLSRWVVICSFLWVWRAPLAIREMALG